MVDEAGRARGAQRNRTCSTGLYSCRRARRGVSSCGSDACDVEAMLKGECPWTMLQLSEDIRLRGPDFTVSVVTWLRHRASVIAACDGFFFEFAGLCFRVTIVGSRLYVARTRF